MAGTIEKRGVNKYRIRAFAGRENGRIQWVSRTITASSEKAAEKELAKLVADTERQLLKVSGSETVAQLIEAWLADVRPYRSAYTWKEYRRLADADIIPALGEIRVDKLTAKHLDDYYSKLASRGLTARTVRRHHFLLRPALERAVKWGLIAVNPAHRTTPPPLTKKAVSCPTPEVVRLLLAECEEKNPDLGMAVALAAFTGARRGELCALRWSDILGARRQLKVERSLTHIGNLATEGDTKTHNQRRMSLDDAVEAFLAARKRFQEERAELVGVKLVDDPYVLSRTADGSTPYVPDQLTDNYRTLTRRLGYPGHIHELRHFNATMAIAGGMDIRTVSARLGHAHSSTTLNLYTHFIEARDRELTSLLSGAVFGPVKRSIEAQTATDSSGPDLHGPGRLAPAS